MNHDEELAQSNLLVIKLINRIFYRVSYASTVLAVIMCLSICPSQVGVVQRWLKLGSH